jgi:hypothetical protein
MTEGWLSHYGRALKALEAVEAVRGSGFVPCASGNCAACAEVRRIHALFDGDDA